MTDDPTNLMVPVTVAGALLFTGTHLLADRFHALVGSGRRPLHSFLAGFTTGYVFLQLLPGVGKEPRGESLPPALEGHQSVVYFGLALVAFCVYYALEVRAWSEESGEEDRGGGAGVGRRRPDAARPHPHVYRVHLATFGAVNAMVAFLLPHYGAEGLGPGAIYIVAVVVHFLVMDRGLAEMHGGRYGPSARVFHSGAVVGGAGVGLLVGPPPPPWMTGLVLSILAGALILQLVREEIPRNQEGRWGAFGMGALTFGVLLGLVL